MNKRAPIIFGIVFGIWLAPVIAHYLQPGNVDTSLFWMLMMFPTLVLSAGGVVVYRDTGAQTTYQSP